MGVDTR